jgi:sulfur-oxidizing protein SoxY
VPLFILAATPASADTWASLAHDIFNGRPLADGNGLISIEMPARAEDAAIVPVTMRVMLPPGDTRRLETLTLVIDENPVPVAATFTFGDRAGVSAISTRVRVDAYTRVHLVAELSDGKLYSVETHVKASGGCSAPAAKNLDEAIASLGRMKLRAFGKPTGGPREAQIMIRHPNNSGLQRDPLSHLYVPANFLRSCACGRATRCCSACKPGFRSRKIRTSASPTCRTEPRRSKPRAAIPTAKCSAASGR